MNPTKNHPLQIETFKDLAQSSEAHAVSIYLPMYKKGKEQNEQLAQANLKSCIKEVHTLLCQYQLSEDEINNYIQPLKALIVQNEIWRNPSQGLAIFMDRKGVQHYSLPIPFETKVYVASQFYLKPLLPLYSDDDQYYVLELSQDYVKLYEATKFTFKDITEKKLLPASLKKVVGEDYKSKMLQHRSAPSISGGGMIHGYGEGKDDVKKELLKFYKAVDVAILKTLKNTKAPLVLSCTDEVFYHYKSISKYPNIFDSNVSGDPEFVNKNKLHEVSWELLQPYFNTTRNEKIESFKELYNTSKTGYEISEILPLAVEGKVDTLFVQEDVELYGIYNKINRFVRLDPEKNTSNTSLINLAALDTFLQGGNVYFLKADEMPFKDRPLNAIYRY